MHLMFASVCLLLLHHIVGMEILRSEVSTTNERVFHSQSRNEVLLYEKNGWGLTIVLFFLFWLFSLTLGLPEL